MRLPQGARGALHGAPLHTDRPRDDDDAGAPDQQEGSTVAGETMTTRTTHPSRLGPPRPHLVPRGFHPNRPEPPAVPRAHGHRSPSRSTRRRRWPRRPSPLPPAGRPPGLGVPEHISSPSPHLHRDPGRPRPCPAPGSPDPTGPVPGIRDPTAPPTDPRTAGPGPVRAAELHRPTCSRVPGRADHARAGTAPPSPGQPRHAAGRPPG